MSGRDNGTSELPLDALVAAFLTGDLPREQWTHRAHLRVGAWHVARYGAEEALARLRTAIRALNDRHGTPNTDNSGYHETVTAAYCRVIGDFLAACAPALTLEQKIERLLLNERADRSYLLRFWPRDVLFSVEARRSMLPLDVLSRRAG